MSGKEKILQTKIVDFINSLDNSKAIPIQGQYIEAGTPDIIAVVKGKPVFIETKRPGEKPRPLQKKRLQEWEQTGAFTFWTDDFGIATQALLTLTVKDFEIGDKVFYKGTTDVFIITKKVLKPNGEKLFTLKKWDGSHVVANVEEKYLLKIGE